MTIRSTTPSAARPTPSPRRGSVRSLGALGDGHADDSAAIRRALLLWDEVIIERGDYKLSLDGNGNALTLARPGTSLILQPGAVLRLSPSGSRLSAVISISASDCSIVGGTVVGDLLPLTPGRRGEWGHGIWVTEGADRTRLESVRVIRCWGDGIYVGGGPQDVVIKEVVSDSNRRQGLSITHALRPQVLGGEFTNTGSIIGTPPSAGIDIEPNSASESVTGLSIDGALIEGNKGKGLLLEGARGRLRASVANISASANGEDGIHIRGSGAQVSVRDVKSTSNATGVVVADPARGTQLTRCLASENAGHGFDVAGPATVLAGCQANFNGASGFLIEDTAAGTQLNDSAAASNGRRARGASQVDVYSPDALLNRVTSIGSSIDPPENGFAIRATAVRTRLISITSEGEFSNAPLVDLRRPGAN